MEPKNQETILVTPIARQSVSTFNKIKELEELSTIVADLQALGKRIVHCHGVFDLLHIGHIRYFQQAKQRGDVLIVTATPDRYVNKGPDRPVFQESLRLEALASLECIDYVGLNRWPTAVETIQLLRPDFYVKGSDYKDAKQDLTGGILLEKEAVESVGGRLFFTEDITFSSSNLLNQHFSSFSDEIRQYIEELKRQHQCADIIQYLKDLAHLNVLVIGETIIDEYIYCNAMGKSGKEPVLAAQYVDKKKFAGGILAVGNQVTSFCNSVSLMSFLGQQNSQEEFVRENLSPKITPTFLYLNDAPTIVKRRFVQIYPFQKLFQIYIMDDEAGASQSENLCTWLNEHLPAFDVVIVTDYGHGMISPEVVKTLCDKARFLAVNTQLNAGNHGFNTISKYPHVNYICISEQEIRLEVRSQRRDLPEIIQEVAEKLSCEQVIITRGQHGCLCYSKTDGFIEVPAFSTRVVDRVGAGDAVLAVTSLCAAMQVPLNVSGFIGCLVGAEAVTIINNERVIDAVKLYKYIETLLK